MSDIPSCAHCGRQLTGRFVEYGGVALCNWVCVNKLRVLPKESQ